MIYRVYKTVGGFSPPTSPLGIPAPKQGGKD